MKKEVSEYIEDIKTYTDTVDPVAVDTIVKYCGIALRSRDGSLVAASDKKELDTVVNGFANKQLKLSAEEAQAGVDKVCEAMKGTHNKSRVTFYYLLAEHTVTMAKLTGG